MPETQTDDLACPGCNCLPGDGRTPTCFHPEGCGYFRELERNVGNATELKAESSHVDEDEDDERELEDLDGDVLLRKWQDKNRAYSFEGETGVARLEKLVEALGYRGHQFKYGDPVQQFLADNSGAMEALICWIEEQVEENPEWKEKMVEALQDESEDDGN